MRARAGNPENLHTPIRERGRKRERAGVADGAARLVTPRHVVCSWNPKLGADGASAVASALPALTALTSLDIR
jgi:hypothetical protein